MINKREEYQKHLKSDFWQILRSQAIYRDDAKCSFCNADFVNVHHIKYPKRFKSDHIDNLICVCKKCHNLLHGIRNNTEQLEDVIKKRMCFEEDNEDYPTYLGLDMSATHGHSMEEARYFNFKRTIDLFGDYLPNMNSENFNLFCWKGSIGWVNNPINERQIKEVMTDDIDGVCFSGCESKDIFLWIIKNKWDIK